MRRPSPRCGERARRRAPSAASLLERGKVDAILMDRPIVEYYCQGEAWCRKKYAISLPLSRMMVAFALPEGSEGFRAGFNDAAGTNRSRARAAAVLGDELNVEMIKLYDEARSRTMRRSGSMRAS